MSGVWSLGGGGGGRALFGDWSSCCLDCFVYTAASFFFVYIFGGKDFATYEGGKVVFVVCQVRSGVSQVCSLRIRGLVLLCTWCDEVDWLVEFDRRGFGWNDRFVA